MMGKRVYRAVVVVLLCALFGLMSAGAAFAIDPGTVPNHAIVGSADLYGMTFDEARATISREASVTHLPALQLTSAGKSFTLAASQCLVLDVETMLARACTTTADGPITLTRSATVSSAPVVAFTKKVAKSIYRPRSSAKYYVKGSKLKWSKAVYGRALNQSAAVTAITRELLAEAGSGSARPALALAYKSSKPAVTDKKLGRAILVDLSLRKLRLYDHSKMLKKYGVAIGMPRYATPKGTFKVTAKVKNPTWRNPGSAWASSMPAYIAPGRTNPLGTRALYINASGIRIHGTHKTSSIGQAASHGCVRVANANIEKLYPLVPVGTKVFIIK